MDENGYYFKKENTLIKYHTTVLLKTANETKHNK